VLKVGVYAPYARTETTIAATQFADWLVRMGVDVQFLACGKVGKNIHPVWDSKANSISFNSICSWADQSTHLCWFLPDEPVFSTAHLICPRNKKRRTRHFFLPGAEQWNASSLLFAKQMDSTILLSTELHKWATGKVTKLSSKLKFANANLVAPSIPFSAKAGFVEKGFVSVAAVLSKTMHADKGPSMLNAIDRALAERPNLKVTLVLEHSFSRQFRRAFKQLAELHVDRVKIIDRPSYSELAAICWQHDWVFVGATRFNYGSLLTAAAASASPVACLDLMPAKSLLDADHGAILIPCKKATKSKPVADFEEDAIVRFFLRVSDITPTAMKSFQRYAGVNLEASQISFEQFLHAQFFL
jgi:hypothetical protein